MNEELKFTIVLVSDGSGIFSSSWGFNLGLFFGIRARVRSRVRSGAFGLGGFLSWLLITGAIIRRASGFLGD